MSDDFIGPLSLDQRRTLDCERARELRRENLKRLREFKANPPALPPLEVSAGTVLHHHQPEPLETSLLDLTAVPGEHGQEHTHEVSEHAQRPASRVRNRFDRVA